jgi:hypothetical protein
MASSKHKGIVTHRLARVLHDQQAGEAIGDDFFLQGGDCG